MTGPRTTKLTCGQRFTAVTTAMNGGKRVYRDVTLVSSRDQDVEPFIVGRTGSPDQDRVFVERRMPVTGGTVSVPELVLAGSVVAK